MAAPKKLPPLNTPRGVAVFPNLNTPDTKFKPEGEYAVRLAFNPQDSAVQALIAELEKRRDAGWDAHLASLEAGERKKFEKAYSKAPVFTEEVDKEGDETGRILINFKMKATGKNKKTGKDWAQKPTILDAKGVKMENAPDIYGGSTLRIGFETTTSPVPSSKLYYLSCRLMIVKVLDLVTKGGYSADAFGLGDEEDGYEADESEVTAATQSKQSSNDSNESGDEPEGEEDF
jgi:hypothetical protein